MINKAERHAKCMGFLWRQAGISVTPKCHLIESHGAEMLRRTQGFGDMGKDAAERSHQDGIRSDLQTRGLRSIVRRSNAQAQWEAMKKNKSVDVQIDRVAKKSARVFKSMDRESSAIRQKVSKMDRDEKRDALLALPLPMDAYVSFVDRKKATMLT